MKNDLTEDDIIKLHFIRVTLELGLDDGWMDFYDSYSEYQKQINKWLDIAKHIAMRLQKGHMGLYSCLELRDEQALATGILLPAGLYFTGNYDTEPL